MSVTWGSRSSLGVLAWHALRGQAPADTHISYIRCTASGESKVFSSAFPPPTTVKIDEKSALERYKLLPDMPLFLS